MQGGTAAAVGRHIIMTVQLGGTAAASNQLAQHTWGQAAAQRLPHCQCLTVTQLGTRLTVLIPSLLLHCTAMSCFYDLSLLLICQLLQLQGVQGA
jgi:hypothetical protein